MSKKMISVKEIAEETGISKRTLYRWMDEGKLPFPWYNMVFARLCKHS